MISLLPSLPFFHCFMKEFYTITIVSHTLYIKYKTLNIHSHHIRGGESIDMDTTLLTQCDTALTSLGTLRYCLKTTILCADTIVYHTKDIKTIVVLKGK